MQGDSEPDKREPISASHANDRAGEAVVEDVCQDLILDSEDPADLYRYLGYPAGITPPARIADRISEVVLQARRSLQPRGVYSIYVASEQTEHSLKLGSLTIAGQIGKFLQGSVRVAAFVVTVGEKISRLAEAAGRDGDIFSAWVMDTLGSLAAERTADALMRRIRGHLGHGQELTLRYSPGYCGMDMGQQRKLFRLVRADAVEVTLTPSMLMHPLKSISGLVGFAPEEVVSRYHSPCDMCDRATCPMRR